MEWNQHRIVKARVVELYKLELQFSDGNLKVVDLEPVLHGQMYQPLREKDFFERIKVDIESGAIQWPNGADFDPNILYEWEKYSAELAERALQWKEKNRAHIR